MMLLQRIDKRQARVIENRAIRTEPVGLSQQELWERLHDLAALDGAENYVRAASLTFDETDGWHVTVEEYDPRVDVQVWRDRLVGTGQTIPEALDAADNWAKSVEGWRFDGDWWVRIKPAEAEGK